MDLANFIEVLDSNTKETLQLANSCSTTQLYLEKKESWSIIQILEHICNADKIVSSVLSKPSNKMAASSELIGDVSLKQMVVDQREVKKFRAPDILEPQGLIPDLKAFEKVFLEQRSLLKHNLQSGKLIIDNRIHNHPIIGEMTISDWLIFLVYHTQRHLEQIKDRKATLAGGE